MQYEAPNKLEFGFVSGFITDFEILSLRSSKYFLEFAFTQTVGPDSKEYSPSFERFMGWL